jgi:DNA-binding MarR family transcriptional regulator
VSEAGAGRGGVPKPRKRPALARPSRLPREIVAGYTVARLSRLIARDAATRVKEILGLRLAEFRVLLLLDRRQGTPLDELADVALLETSHASIAAASLLRKGLIERRVDPHDRRRVQLRRSASGTRAVQRYLSATAGERRALWGALTAAERQQLVGLLERLIAAAPVDGRSRSSARARGRTRA